MIWRAILGAVAGYVAIAVVIIGCFTAAYAVMGVDGAFEPGSWKPSGNWNAMSVLVGLVAAIVGGLVAATIGRQPGVLVLATVVLVLGVVVAVLQSVEPAVTTPRPAVVSNQEAASNAQEPAWVTWSNPLLGLAGVLIGGSLRRRREV